MRNIAILLFGLLILPAYASVKVDVFNAEVVLDEGDVDTENAAKSAGLKQVIVKASGDKSAASNPVVVKALRKSGQYLSQLSYGEQSEIKSLKMVFNPPQIQSLLMQADLPYWSDERANIIVWIVEESRYGRDILWEQSGHGSINQIKYFADLRGLPITIPVGDIEDVTGITAPELWGNFVSPISSASFRYPGDAVLVIRVQQLADRSQVRWTLYDEKPEFMFASQRAPLLGTADGEIHTALEQVIDEVSNYYAEKSAVRTSGELKGTVEVQFLNITSANRFFALEKLLKEKNSVASLDVQKVTGGDVTFSINLLTEQAEFEEELLQSDNIKKFEIDMQPSVGSSVDTNSEVAQSGDFGDSSEVISSQVVVEEDSNETKASIDASQLSSNNNDVMVGIAQEEVKENEVPIIIRHDESYSPKVMTFEWID